MNTKQGIAPIAAIIIGLLVIGGGAYAIKKGVDKKEKKEKTEMTEEKDKTATSTSGALHIKLSEQNNSGQKGEVTITRMGTSSVKVILNITGKPATTTQPAHIHVGVCPNPGAVKYPLTSVDKGASQTELQGVTIESLLAQLPLAINVHKSAAESGVYVACGNIEAKATSTKVSIEKSKETKKVTYNAQGFSPKSVTVQKGDTVLFENKTGKSASVASMPHPTHELYPEFDQFKTDAQGKDEFKFTFDKVGTWQYHDHLNTNMTGTVIVIE
ncbi:MAG: cupredoxin domain-containing protein [bacterium]|nr:cupredoxin domain-containing protein [bacterium]